MSKTPRSSLGFSMIEVLITLLLVCIGVLGMVAMQGRTQQYTQDSVQRNNAAMLANDLIELIRANPNGPPAFYKAKGTAFASAPGTGCSSTTQVPADQLACWAQKTAKVLPGVTTALLTSDFYICRSTTPGDGDATACPTTGSTVEIKLVWTVKAGECMDSSDSNNVTSTLCSYRLRTQI
jgi:type IV pilus assembly protein PilV